jgi:trigger factor
MSATATDTTAAEDTYTYDVTIADAGPGTKRVSVKIPADRVSAKIAEQLKELKTTAAIPGFRVGRAPQALIEKKFGSELRDQVRRSLISESLQQAIEKNDLQTVGDPEFENAEALNAYTGGELAYAFTVEVQPTYTLPDLSSFTVKKPKIAISEANVDQAVQNLKEQQGVLAPVEDRGVEPKDFLLADVHLLEAGQVIGHMHDQQIVARPGRVGGIQVNDLDVQLTGLKVGSKKSIEVKVPDDHPQTALRGKTLQIEVALKELKKLEPRELDAVFLEELGFSNVDEVRQALREQLDERVTSDVKQAMRDQLAKHLLETVQMELPSKMSARQSNQVVQRRAMDLLQRGVPQEQIRANLDSIRGGADAQAQRELKLFFILQKVANDNSLEVDEEELNGRIALMAAFRAERPEKLKQAMAKDGSLQNLYLQMREQLALDKLIESAKVEEVEVAQNADGTMIKPETDEHESSAT